MTRSRIWIAGAGSALGVETVRAAIERGLKVTASMRTENPNAEDALRNLGAEVVQLDLLDSKLIEAHLKFVDAAIFIPILTVSKNAAGLLAAGQRAVFFSSNNVAIDPEAKAYAALIDAERETRSVSRSSTILRPTMIYGYPGDGNISQLMKLMRRARFAPMPGDGRALQQPVYYKDLARAAVDALLDEGFCGVTCAVAGPEAVSQQELYEKIAGAAGIKARVLPLPKTALAAFLNMAERLGLRLPLSAAQVRRSSLDKIPRGDEPIITETSLKDGLKALAAELKRR